MGKKEQGVSSTESPWRRGYSRVEAENPQGLSGEDVLARWILFQNFISKVFQMSKSVDRFFLFLRIDCGRLKASLSKK